MKPRHQISRAALELIKRFEGYRPKAAKLADGRWTIGYGHTLTAREGAEVSEADAEALLLYDLIAVAHAINEGVFTPLNQNQFDALCCFAFNIGVDNLRRSSVLRRINEGQLLQAACGMELWRKAEFEGEPIVIDALVRRRAAEKTLFLTPIEGWTPAPSAILRPNIDADVTGLVPRQTPAVIRATFDSDQAIAVRDPSPGVTPTPPDEEPSPAQAAAAAVSFRLQTIFREEPEAETPSAADNVEAFPGAHAPDAASEASPVAAESPVAEPSPFEAPAHLDSDEAIPDQTAGEADQPFAGEAALIASGDHENPFEPPAEAGGGPGAVQDETPGDAAAEEPLPRLVIEEPQELESQAEASEPTEAPGEFARSDLLKVLALAGAGLSLFAGGLFWAFNAEASEGGAISPAAVGWIAGVVGLGLFSVAAYRLLQHLGQEEPDDNLRA